MSPEDVMLESPGAWNLPTGSPLIKAEGTQLLSTGFTFLWHISPAHIPVSAWRGRGYLVNWPMIYT